MRNRVLVFTLLLVTTAPLGAQRFTATLRGTVTAPDGGALPGATVSVTEAERGLSRSVATNVAGAYAFADLPVGNYRVQVELDGFQSEVVTGLRLNVADTRELDFVLELGTVEDVITVSSPPLQIETIGGEVAGLVTGEQVRELPLNGRNFVQLTQLMPGVSTPEGGFDPKNKGLLGGVDLSVSGSSVTANMWSVDGANNNDVGSNRTVLIYPSIDAIEEFKIHRNSYGAEFGGAGGAQINLVTRAGTNDFKGTLFYFTRDDSLNATNFFLERAGKDTEPLSRDDFGFTFGGPIKSDRAHFFISGEWNDETRGVVRSGFVPTAAERSGDFSAGGIAGCSPPTPTDPLTGEPFPGNVIPPDRLSEAGRRYLSLYPLPNSAPIGGSCTNWTEAVVTPIDWRQYNARVDWSVTDSSRLLVRYTDDNWENAAPNAGEANGLWGDDPFPAVDSSWDQPSTSLVAQLNQVLGAKAANTITFSMSGNEIDIGRGGNEPGLNSAINAAIPSVFPGDQKTGGVERSHPVFWGGQGYAPLWNIAPWRNEQDLLVLKDDYERVFGRHLLKAGASYSDNSKFEFCCGSSASETPQFWGAAGINGWGATSGNVLADFLLKDMTWGFSETSFEPAPEVNWEDIELYIADSWQATPRLSLDYGLRYSRYREPHATDNNITSFDPDRFDPALGGDPCNGITQVPGTDPCGEAGFLGGSPGPSDALVEGDTDNFAPRLGLAWDVFGNGESVLRAGFGQFYQRERVNIQLDFANQAPFTSASGGIRKLDDASEPCDGCFGINNPIPLRGIDPDFETPYNLQFNLTWEQRLGRSNTFEVGYVGNRGRHLVRRSDINQVPAGDRNGNGISDRLEYVQNSGDGAAQAALRPFGVFGDTTILFWESNGTSEYDSLQAQFITRFGNASQFQASYTLSRLKSDDPLTDSGAGTFDGQITDRDNPGLDWGYAGTHRDHVFNASLLLNGPSFDGAGGFKEYALGNWSLGAVVLYSSGAPLTVYTGSVPGLNNVSGTGFEDNIRPNRVPGVDCSGSGLQVLNPAAFTLTGFQLGTIGNSGRGICDGPDFFQVDLSLSKNFRIAGQLKGQFRIEVFNLLDRDNFIGSSVVDELSPIAVTLNGASPQESTEITGFTAPSNFGQATAARDPRQLQLGVKFFF